MRTFSEFMSIYFIVLIFIGAFFLINLTLAIIKVKFSEAQENSKNVVLDDSEYKKTHFNLEKLKKYGIYKSRKRIS